MNSKTVLFALVIIGASQLIMIPTPAAEERIYPIYVGTSRQVQKLADQHLKYFKKLDYRRSLPGVGIGSLKTLNTQLHNLESKLKNLKAVKLVVPENLFWEHEHKKKLISNAARHRLSEKRLYCDRCKVSFERGDFEFEDLDSMQDTERKAFRTEPRQEERGLMEDLGRKPFDTGARHDRRGARENVRKRPSDSKLSPEDSERINDALEMFEIMDEIESKN